MCMLVNHSVHYSEINVLMAGNGIKLSSLFIFFIFSLC